MTKVNLPGLGAFHAPPEKAKRYQAIIDARHKFVSEYMAEKGWGDDPRKLTIEQILEVRAQPDWKNPKGLPG